MYKILLISLLFTFNAEAKMFRNSYVSFELGKDWSCKLEKTSWVCINAKKSKGGNVAAIILTAKEKGPSDVLSSYEVHLKQPVILKTGKGSQPSKVLNVARRTINHHPWVDSLHQGSEAPNFWTRYLGTVSERIAILVTFSSHKNFYTQYSNEFIKGIQSLRLVNSGSRNFRPGELRGKHELLGAPVSGILADTINIPDEPVLQKKKSSKGKIVGLLFLLLAGALLWYKKKKL